MPIYSDTIDKFPFFFQLHAKAHDNQKWAHSERICDLTSAFDRIFRAESENAHKNMLCYFTKFLKNAFPDFVWNGPHSERICDLTSALDRIFRTESEYALKSSFCLNGSPKTVKYPKNQIQMKINIKPQTYFPR